ncbi:hypothetical protein Bca52824_067706 [Brassica carinata]|uniref:TORTIFOLIA1/SINE1-2 N-terminal domain-containing protein n=1 Tax=Brassica carinata TaxID=52824 RepID=A0A8X7UD40_BRACI|nr:hypothetical protein Bca52824_067706 [Brassica carinata]
MEMVIDFVVAFVFQSNQEETVMGRNLGSAFRQELANLDKDPDTNKTAMSNLRTIVKDLDAKVIHVFLAQVSETKEIGSESGGYTVSLFEDLARAHGVKIAPHVETIMPVIIRTLSSCDGSLGVQQACSKAVAAMARYGIDPATPEDKKRNVHQQHLALGSALCLKSLVDCDNWRFASSEVVNSVCQSLAVALEATSSEAKSHLALVIALAKHNPFIVEAYDSQKRLLAVQMLNFLMKYLNPKSICSELELIFKEMEKHLTDEMYFVRMAAYETMSTAERLIRESADPVFDAENSKSRISLSGSMKSTPSLRAHNMSHWKNCCLRLSFGELCWLQPRNGSVLESPRYGNQFQFPGIEDYDMESVMFHQRNRSSEFNESVCSWTNRSRSSRGKPKKRQSGDICSKHHRHGFAQDPFTELVENRQQLLQQDSESFSSSSIYDTSGTTNTTPTEDICEAKVETGETETVTRKARSKRALRWGFSFFSVAVAGFAMWVHLKDDMMMPPHLVPT